MNLDKNATFEELKELYLNHEIRFPNGELLIEGYQKAIIETQLKSNEYTLFFEWLENRKGEIIKGYDSFVKSTRSNFIDTVLNQMSIARLLK